MKSAEVGIVTVTYNSAPYLEAFLASCSSLSSVHWGLYAIDNASRDDSGARLVAAAAENPQIRVTLNERNGGIAEGNNQGIVQALVDGCDWVLLLNNDTTFPPELLSELIQACETREWRVCVPKILYDTPKGSLWYAGGGFNPRRGHTGYHVGKDEVDIGQFDEPAVVDYSPTCCMLVHRSVIEAVGLMDETYFVYFDDTDFCWRLRDAGIAIGYWPSATLVHKVGGSTGGSDSPFTARITARNRLYFLKKHFGSVAPLVWLPLFLSYYGFRYLVRSWQPACFRASLQGSWAYRTLAPRVPPLNP